VNCLVCKQSVHVQENANFQLDAVCGECNENLEGMFKGEQPTFYGVLGWDYALGAALDAFACDRQVVGPYMLQQADVHCACSREETRWPKEHHHHL
jgi:hypothetical protein